MLRTLVLMAVAGGVVGSAVGQDIPIGFYRFGVPAGFIESRPGAISGDGSRIIGRASSAAGGVAPSSFEWSYGTGLTITPNPDSMYLTAWSGLSHNGQVAAGWAYDNAATRYAATAWPSQGQPAILGHYSGYRDTITHDVSGDGRVIVGRSETVIGLSSIGVPVRWTA